MSLGTEHPSTLPTPSTTAAEIAAATRPRRPSKVDSLRPTYGFDDVSLAPGTETVEPSDVDTSVAIGGLRLAIPVLEIGRAHV